jgi:hypothetical protein
MLIFYLEDLILSDLSSYQIVSKILILARKSTDRIIQKYCQYKTKRTEQFTR